MKFRGKLAAILGLFGFPGVLSLLLIDLKVPPELGNSLPLPAFKLLGLIQPTILLTIAVLAGVNLFDKVGLSAPAMVAIASRQPFIPKIKLQILPGLIGGVVGGLSLALTAFLWRPWLPTQLWSVPPTPLIVRFLYGGMTEEILLRWGLMTFLLWGSWVWLQHRQGSPQTLYVAIAISVSAVLFGIGHLPLIAVLGLPLTASLVAYIVLANSLFGMIAGYLYWKHGLEAAILAHLLCHAVLLLFST